MKKFTLAFALVALMPFVSANAYEHVQTKSGYYTSPSVKTNSYKRASTSRKTGGYNNIITNNFYYGQPSEKSYAPNTTKQSGYKKNNYYKATKKQEVAIEKDLYESAKPQERKFFLAHPFFQPLKGKFGSVTDLSYAHNEFNFDMFNARTFNIDRAHSYDPYDTGVYGILDPILSGKSETTQFVVKEDFSYGLTDTLALVLMGQYDSTKTTFKNWSDGSRGDSYSDSGLNLFGIGLQNRFIDNSEWIVMGEAFFQHQKDAANTLMAGVKAGYKIDKTTVYGIGRVVYTTLTKGDAYGALVDGDDGDYVMLTYDTDVDNVFMGETGIGAFAVLNRYFTLNGEMIYGFYDWHNQLNVKGAVAWQPDDKFALNLYASTSLYDSAKGKVKEYRNYDVNPTAYPVKDDVPQYTDSKLLYTIGDYKIKDYNEWKFGIQAIFYF